ncbi:MAG: hypothetical protein KKE50_06655, partial [Nanoarchaeota archaeon]|nr:hypothetical protein [Nanoarchaeota archaeon]
SLLDKIILKNKIPSKAEIDAKSMKKPGKEEKKTEEHLMKEIKTEKAKPEIEKKRPVKRKKKTKKKRKKTKTRK